MEKFNGKKVFSGIAIGKVKLLLKAENQVVRKRIEAPAAEIARYEAAKQTAIEQLHKLYKKALKEVGEVNAQIFDVHAMMLEDGDYNDSVHNLIESQSVNAEYAVGVTGDNFAEVFANMDDEYFKARSIDMKDISERVINVLCGNDMGSDLGDEPVIIVAKDLAPSETVQMDKSKLLAFVTQLGSTNSHTAILARTMGIPALIGVEIKEEWNGKQAIVDGYTGTLIIEPDEAALAEYKKKAEGDAKQKELLLTLKGKENVTIYDYADNHIPMFDNMYMKRLKAYKQIGYELAGSLKFDKQAVNAIYDGNNYSENYHKDLLDSNKNIIISSPVISGSKVYELINMLKEKQMSGVQVTIVTWTPDSYGFGDAAYWMQLHEDMRKAGFYMKTVEESCERFVVIDQEIVWYGNINLLAKSKIDDSIMRVRSKGIAGELMEITFRNNDGKAPEDYEN